MILLDILFEGVETTSTTTSKNLGERAPLMVLPPAVTGSRILLGEIVLVVSLVVVLDFPRRESQDNEYDNE